MVDDALLALGLARVAVWIQEARKEDGGDPCRSIVIEYGVSSVPGETFKVLLLDTGAWAEAHGAWESGKLDDEPLPVWWTASGAGLTLADALTAALEDLQRPGWAGGIQW